MFMRLVGLEMKLRQYELGAKFIDGVERHAGWASLNRAWEGPSSLPTLSEIEKPGALAGASRLTPPVALVLEAVRQALPEGRFVIALSGGADSAIAAWSVAQAVGRESVRGRSRSPRPDGLRRACGGRLGRLRR